MKLETLRVQKLYINILLLLLKYDEQLKKKKAYMCD